MRSIVAAILVSLSFNAFAGPNNNLSVSEVGLEFLKTVEGLRHVAYKDSAGVWTIGYGHTGGVKQGHRVTSNQAEIYLYKDILHHERGVRKHVLVRLEQYQFDALVSFSFNVGRSAFVNSKVLAAVNKKDVVATFQELLRWDNVNGRKSPGLAKRRFLEAALFLNQLETALDLLLNGPKAVDKELPNKLLAARQDIVN